MKTLLVYVYANESTDLTLFRSVIEQKKGIQYVVETREEHLVQALTAQHFDLLILDLDLPKGEYKKAQLMTEMIYPGAAVTELDLQPKDFIDYKLDQLWSKWEEAHTDGQTFFHDGTPGLGSL